MRKFLMIFLCAFVVAACDRDEEMPVLQCGGYDIQMTISENGDTMQANINGDDLELLHVMSASGAKYSGVLNDTVVVLWSKGENWTMMLDEDEIIDCRAK